MSELFLFRKQKYNKMKLNRAVTILKPEVPNINQLTEAGKSFLKAKKNG